MARRAIILSNGDLHHPDILCQRLAHQTAALVIAADGGSHHAATLGLRVDALIGDLDSIHPALRARLEADGTRLEARPPDKDETDLELALLYAAHQGADPIIVLGMLGGRLDMTIANVLLLTHPALSALRAEVWHDWQTAWLIRPPGDTVQGQPGDTLSLIPLGTDAIGVTTHHLKYPLRHETLASGPARGVSNVLAAPTARVELRAGLLLAVHTPGRA
jgi:thiamine pyrophosphokinase